MDVQISCLRFSLVNYFQSICIFIRKILADKLFFLIFDFYYGKNNKIHPILF